MARILLMKKYWFFLGALMVCLGCISLSHTPNYVYAEENIVEETLYLDNYPDSRYYKIGEIESSAQYNDTIFYINTTHQLMSYNITSNQSTSYEIENVTDLRKHENGILYLSDQLYVFQNQQSTAIDGTQGISTFDYYASETMTTLSYIKDDKLVIVTKAIGSSDTTTQQYTLSEKNIEINNIKSITATNSGTILLTEDEYKTLTLHRFTPSSSLATIRQTNLNYESTILENSESLCNCIQIKYGEIDSFPILSIIYQNYNKIVLYIMQSSDSLVGLERVNLEDSVTVFTPSHLDFHNNTLQVCDNTNKSIRTFEISHIDTTPTTKITTMLGSAGSSLDQYQSVSQIVIVDENNIVINDAGNNRIKRIFQGNTTSNDLYPYDTNNSALYITKTVTGEIAVLRKNMTGAYYIEYYAEDNLKDCKSTTTLDNNILSIATPNNQLYIAKADGIYQHTATATTKLADLTLSQPRMFSSKDPSILYCFDTNNSYAINLKTNAVTTFSTALTYTDIDMDYNNQFYTIDGNQLSQYLITEDIQLIKTYALTKEYTTITLDQEKGLIYLFDPTNSSISTIYQADLFDGMNTFVDTTLTSILQPTTLCRMATANDTALTIHPYPYYIGQSTTITSTDDSTTLSFVVIEEQNGFSHIAYFDANNQLQEGYVESGLLKTRQTSVANDQYQVISKTANLFYLPTMQATTSIKLTKNTKITAVSGRISDMSHPDYDFVAIKHEDQILYALASDILLSQKANVTTNTPQNATIVSDNEEVMVYTSADTTSEVVGILTSGTRIVTIQYDEDSVWTKIIYLNEFNQEVEGYIQTKYITADTPSPLVITCVIVSVIAVIILIIVAVNVAKIKKKYDK